MSLVNGVAYSINVRDYPYYQIHEKYTTLLREFNIDASLRSKNLLNDVQPNIVNDQPCAIVLLCFLDLNYQSADSTCDVLGEQSKLFYHYLSRQFDETKKPILPLARCGFSDDGRVLNTIDYPVMLSFPHPTQAEVTLKIIYNNIPKTYLIPKGIKNWRFPDVYFFGCFDVLKVHDFPKEATMWGSLMHVEDRIY